MPGPPNPKMPNNQAPKRTFEFRLNRKTLKRRKRGLTILLSAISPQCTLSPINHYMHHDHGDWAVPLRLAYMTCDA